MPIFAQTGLGVVTGTVQDSTGAAVPSAQLKLTEAGTNVMREATSNSAGIHYFGSVALGNYVLTVEAPGFKKWEGRFQVQAGQSVTVDPKLEVGDLQSTVEVVGAATPIATEGAQISDVKDAKRIHDLPLNGRQVANLFTLTPGVEGGQGASGGGNPRTNGMMVGSTEMLLDGISYVDRFGGGISRVQPGLDTIQEYRIETAGSGAQYSRPATISLVTRSGTNDFHGAVFETARNNAAGLAARARQDGNTPAKLIRNEFGFWAAGRIIKNKTFWFFDQEFLRQREQNFAQTAVPTAEIWGGNFSSMTDTSGNKITIYDPNTSGADGTRLPFANNTIPQARLNTNLIEIFKGVSPAPHGSNAGGNPWIESNFETFYPRTLDTKTTTAKIDQIVSSKDNISGRFTVASQNNKLYGGRYGFPPIGVPNGTGTGRQDTKVYSVLARETHVFSPGLLNEFQASVHRSNNSSGTLGDAINWADKLGMPNPFGATGWPTICTDAYSMFYYGCWDGDNRNAQQLTQFQIEDNVTWVKGRHTVKFGFKGRQEYNNVVELQQAQGSHDFYGDWTAQYDPIGDQAVSYTGSGLAGLELGLPTNLRNQYNRGYFYFRQKEIGLYVNDTWKLTSRLTLDAGLRWDYWTPYSEKYNRLVNLDLNSVNKGLMQVVFPGDTTLDKIPGIPSGVSASWSQRGLTTTSANSIGFPSALTPNVNTNFAPRIGLAYRLGDKWAVRGGYGVYYWPMPLSQLLQAARSNAPLNLRFVNQVSRKNGQDVTYGLRSVPAPTDYIGQATVDVNSVQGISSSAQSFQAMDVNDWKDNRMQQWTFSVEREVARNTVVKFSYNGNHGSNLQQHVDYNAAETRYNYQARTGLLAPSNADLRRVNPNWNLSGSVGVLGHSGFLSACCTWRMPPAGSPSKFSTRLPMP
ncbi:MAG: TonB-dependent receptor [Bryobacteraceae bacterium]